MKRVSKYGSFLALVGTLGLTSCLKTEEFPPQPSIAFKSFEQFADSAVITIGFTDGDGDIGLGQDQTDPPHDTSSYYYYNYYLEYFLKENGSWVLKDTIGHRIPVITPTGQNKALEGEIARRFEAVQIPGFESPWYANLDDADENDTVRFECLIIDRALNVSNKVSTGEIVLE